MHGVKREAVRLAGREHGHDVRMLELGGELDLAAEAVHADAGGEFRREHLDHHRAAERRLLRDEHARHATAPELTLEDIRGPEGAL